MCCGLAVEDQGTNFQPGERHDCEFEHILRKQQPSGDVTLTFVQFYLNAGDAEDTLQ